MRVRRISLGGEGNALHPMFCSLVLTLHLLTRYAVSCAGGSGATGPPGDTGAEGFTGATGNGVVIQ